MGRVDSRKHRNKRLWRFAVALSLAVVISSCMLLGYLAVYYSPTIQNYIPLTQSTGITTVTVGRIDSEGNFKSTGYQRDNHLLLTANPGFQVTDEEQVWQGLTDIEIFHITYKDDSGGITVHSNNGDKVVAPGTRNIYKFALENTGNVPLKYSMNMRAYFSHGPYTIPIYARVKNHQEKYLVGSENRMEDIVEINTVSEEGTIRAGYIMPYTLEWEWPFEVDNEYDTMLGNMAMGEDITLTIEINTLASYTPEPGSNDIPKTGDTGEIFIMSVIMVASAAGISLIFLFLKRKEDESNP